MFNDEYFMKLAIEQAETAYSINETPIGCVIVHENTVISTGYNRRNTDKNSISHAEMDAISSACKVLGDWRLEECILYVTVEPCPMCAGAILQSRITRVVYGAKNYKAGCCGSVVNLLDYDGFNHKVQVLSGVLEYECSKLMKDFFKSLRNANI